MVAALSPADINYDETLSTLRCVLGGGGAVPAGQATSPATPRGSSGHQGCLGLPGARPIPITLWDALRGCEQPGSPWHEAGRAVGGLGGLPPFRHRGHPGSLGGRGVTVGL